MGQMERDMEQQRIQLNPRNFNWILKETIYLYKKVSKFRVDKLIFFFIWFQFNSIYYVIVYVC